MAETINTGLNWQAEGSEILARTADSFTLQLTLANKSSTETDMASYTHYRQLTQHSLVITSH